MIFPKGEVVHQNLSTEYTDVPDLLSTLTSNGFAGYVEVELSQQKGAFFIRKGQVLGAALESDSDQATPFGQESMDELLGLASKEVGTLTVHKLTTAQVDAIVARFRAEIVFKGLTTDFVKLDKFIQKLNLESHTGYIEIFSKMNKFMGTLFLKDGELVDLHIPSESDDTPVSDFKAIPAFLEDVIRQGAVFDVYRSFIENIPSAQKDEADLKIVGKEENVVEVQSESAADAEVAHQPDDHTDEEIEERLDEVGDERNELNPNGRNEALDLLQEAIEKTEIFVDGFSHEGIFIRAFKRALIERSELYPFLDPFTDQFDYRHGKIVLDEDVALEQFALGIADSFNLTLSHLKKEFPKNMNLSMIRGELETKFKQYEEAMRRSGVQPVPQFFLK